jgi:hypothetical protein
MCPLKGRRNGKRKKKGMKERQERRKGKKNKQIKNEKKYIYIDKSKSWEG